MNQEQAIRITAGGVIIVLLGGVITTLVVHQNSPEIPDNSPEESRTIDRDDRDQENAFEDEGENTENQDEDDSDSHNEEQQTSSQASKIGTGDFHYNEEKNTYLGTVFLQGYASKRELGDLPYPYVYFNIQESENEMFDEFVQGKQGNSFFGPDKVGLGCDDGEQLNYLNSNTSEESGTQRYRYIKSSEESQEIFDSTADNPITIKLNRYYDDGMNATGGPFCFSFFTQVHVMDGEELMFEADIEGERERGDEYSGSNSEAF